MAIKKMNKSMVIAVVASLAIGALGALAATDNLDFMFSDASRGNGGPSGAHTNLNIIGVKNKGDETGYTGGGKVIFVPLQGSCRIDLGMGDFAVLDKNCLDDGRAKYQLPSPDADNDGVTTYSVFARALGKPGGMSETQTCLEDKDTTGEVIAEYCSINTTVQVRNKGKSSFTNVSRELLYVYADVDGDGVVDRLPLFDDRLGEDGSLDSYYWKYQNNNLKLLQLRFYPIATDVN